MRGWEDFVTIGIIPGAMYNLHLVPIALGEIPEQF